MRVTEKMMFDNLRTQISNSQESLFEAQRQASTLQRVDQASDDPVSATRSLVAETGLQRIEGMSEASTQVRNELYSAESALSEAQSRLSRLREIAVLGSTDTIGPLERQVLAEEVDGIREDMIGLANTRMGDVFVFGGYQTDSEPFQADGSYVGDSGIRQVEVAPGISARANVTGDNVFGAAGGVDVFGILEDLRDDLLSNDPDAVATHLTDLDTGINQVSDARANLGFDINRLDSADNIRSGLEVDFAEAYSSSIGAEPVDAYTELMEIQSAFRAALSQATRIIQGMAESSFV